MEKRIGLVGKTVRGVLDSQQLTANGALGLLDADDIDAIEQQTRKIVQLMAKEEAAEMFGISALQGDLFLKISEHKVILMIAQVVREEGITKFLPPSEAAPEAPPEVQRANYAKEAGVCWRGFVDITRFCEFPLKYSY